MNMTGLEGWRAVLAWLVSYIPKWFTCLLAVTHAISNPVPKMTLNHTHSFTLWRADLLIGTLTLTSLSPSWPVTIDISRVSVFITGGRRRRRKVWAGISLTGR